MELPWRFEPTVLGLEERFGYRQQVWPHARSVVDVRPGMRVLDVGCGTGAWTRFLAYALEGRGELVGVDHDEALLAKAREEMPSTPGLATRFERGSCYDLPFEDHSFDAVLSGFLLCVLPEPLRALREMRRVVRPGGMIASLSCFCKSGIFPTFQGLHEFEGRDRLEELLRRFVDLRRVHVRNPALGLPNGRDLDVWADYARAGLLDLRIHGYLTVFAPSDARWSDEEAREYVEGRRRIELGFVDQLTADQRARLEKAGFSPTDLHEMRALLERKYEWLLADDTRIRRGMELFTDPAVLITGRVPGPHRRCTEPAPAPR